MHIMHLPKPLPFPSQYHRLFETEGAAVEVVLERRHLAIGGLAVL